MEGFSDEKGKLQVTVFEYTKKKSPAGDRYLPLSEYEVNLFQTVKKLMKRQGIRMVISSSVMKREEPRFMRLITVSGHNVLVQESW